MVRYLMNIKQQGLLLKIGGGNDQEWPERVLEPMRDFDRTMLEFFKDNVAICLSSLIVLGVGLCRATGRVCTPEEHSTFFKENIDVVTTLASHTRHQLKQSARRSVFPYDYGYKILPGDAEMTQGNYLVAKMIGDGKYRAQWTHPEVAEGNRQHPGHCPGSDNNKLKPRTVEDLAGVTVSLGQQGLGGLITDEGVTSAQLVLSRLLPTAQRTVYTYSV